MLALAGGPAPVPGPGQRLAPVERGGRRVAELVYDASLDEDPELVEAVAAAAAIAIENERLHAESQTRLEEIKASRERIVAAGDAERRRLERNLHDGAQQRLVAIALQLRLLQDGWGTTPRRRRWRRPPATSWPSRWPSCASSRAGCTRRCSSMGSRRRSTRWRAAPRSPRPCRARRASGFRTPSSSTAYFVVSEALANVAKYSHATHATVRLWRGDGHAGIEIADDGVGGADAARGSGLRGLADRVEALDGHLRVVSPRGRRDDRDGGAPLPLSG